MPSSLPTEVRYLCALTLWQVIDLYPTFRYTRNPHPTLSRRERVFLNCILLSGTRASGFLRRNNRLSSSLLSRPTDRRPGDTAAPAWDWPSVQIGRAHVRTPVTVRSRMPSS